MCVIYYKNSVFGDEQYGAYYPVFLNIRNPRVIDAHEKSILNIDQVRNKKSQDGVIVKDVFDPTFEESSEFEYTNYVVFDPNQIKSATDNNVMQANKNKVKQRLFNLTMNHDTTLLTV